MSKLMVKDGDIWVPMEGLKGDTGPLPADNSVTNDALVTDGAKTNTAYLMGNRLTKDAEGEFISVDDSYPSAALSLTVDGKSTQVTTTGKNLLSDQTGDYVVAVVGGDTRRYFAISAEEGAKYAWHRASKGYGFYIAWTDSLVSPITVYDSVTMTNRASYTFTNSDNHAYLIVYYSTSYTAAEWVASVNSHEYHIEKGAAFTSYEPYSGGAASPRPDWPQEIESIDGILLTTCGKNFVPNDDPENPNANYVFNSSRRVVYDSEVGGFHLTDSGTGIAYTKHAAPSLISSSTRAAFVAPRDGTYTFGVDTKNYSSDPDEAAYGVRVTLNGTVLNGYGWGAPGTETEWTRYSITRTLSKGQYFGGNIYHSAAWRNISVVAGEEDAYEPYSGGTSSLLPEGTSLRSLPDGTKDELHLTYIRPSTRPGWAYYRGEKIKRVGHKVVTAFDGIGRSSASVGANTVSFYVDLLEYAQNVLGRCSHAEWRVASSSTYNYFRVGWIWISWNGTKRIYMSISNAFNTLALANEWLAENGPIIFDYKKETPETIDLGIFELPAMQSGITNLWSDPSTNLSVTYERDRNIVITNLKAAVADLATS